MKDAEITRFAVYGTLKRTHWNNRRLGNARFIGEHVTEPEYTMYNSGFPIVVEGGTTAISCEIFETDDPAVEEHVNQLEGFTGVKDHPNNWYDRKTIETPFGPAEMFYMKTTRDLPVIASGVWGR